MQRLVIGWRRLVSGDEGATMVEYALMIALIAIVCVAAVTLLGVNTNTVFGNGALAAAL